VEQRPFDIIALIFGEIELLILDRNRTKDLLLYAHTDLLPVIEDGLRPTRDSLASMEGRIDRVKGGPALPMQHTTPAQIPSPHSFLAPSL
jgi:hypothetical protein